MRYMQKGLDGGIGKCFAGSGRIYLEQLARSHNLATPIALRCPLTADDRRETNADFWIGRIRACRRYSQPRGV